MSRPLVVGTARTPFGKLGGRLSSLSATTLGGEALRHAVARSGVVPCDVEHVIMGNVVQAGVGMAGARRAALNAGLPRTTSSETVNKLCASGLVAIARAADLLRLERHAVVAAGGMESMSNAPYLLSRARFGYRFGDAEIEDALYTDALLEPFFDELVSAQASRVASEFGVTREEQDAFALSSHQRAAAASRDGRFSKEIAPVAVARGGRIAVEALRTAVPDRVPVLAHGAATAVWDHQPPPAMTSDPRRYAPYTLEEAVDVVDFDEPVRANATLAALAKLRPIDAGGTITAGNAPGVNDGAAAVVLSSDTYALEHGLEPLAEVCRHAYVAWETPYLALTPAMAASKLLAEEGLRVSDVAVWEINEAFAAVALTSAARLGLGADQFNRNGGAVALGHPVGASGARIIAAVVHQLRERGGGLGIAAICSGSGQGDALLLRVE